MKTMLAEARALLLSLPLEYIYAQSPRASWLHPSSEAQLFLPGIKDTKSERLCSRHFQSKPHTHPHEARVLLPGRPCSISATPRNLTTPSWSPHIGLRRYSQILRTPSTEFLSLHYPRYSSLEYFVKELAFRSWVRAVPWPAVMFYWWSPTRFEFRASSLRFEV